MWLDACGRAWCIEIDGDSSDDEGECGGESVYLVVLELEEGGGVVLVSRQDAELYGISAQR